VLMLMAVTATFLMRNAHRSQPTWPASEDPLASAHFQPTPAPPYSTLIPAEMETMQESTLNRTRASSPQPSADPESSGDLIDHILDSDREANDKAMAMLERFDQWTEDEQVEAVRHMVNLMDDPHFMRLHPLLLNPNSPAMVLDSLMDDLLLRPATVRLPLLLELARNENHPLHEEAASLLAFYLDEDFGKDWSRWVAAVENWLANQGA